MTFIVAIDGAAGTGKGTIAKGISKEFNSRRHKFDSELNWLKDHLFRF